MLNSTNAMTWSKVLPQIALHPANKAMILMLQRNAPIHHACLFFLLMASCTAQPGSDQSVKVASADTGPTDSYTPYTDTTGQLAEYVVNAFADSKGILWFGTMGKGVARYDGKSLTFLSPADGAGGDVVSSIAEDKDGNLWFAGHEGTGLCRHDGHTFTQLWEDEGSVTADRDGNIWASKPDGIQRFVDGAFVELELPIDRRSITTYAITPGEASFAMLDSKGNQWFRSDGAGAIKYDGTSFTRFTKKDGLCSNSVNDILEDDAGNIWFICMQAYQPKMSGDGGLCRYDGKSFTTFPKVDGLYNNDLYTLFKDMTGNIWIGATGTGAYRFDGKEFTLFNTTDRPDINASFGLQGMTQDRDGNYWCGFSGGLFRLAASAATSAGGEQFVNVTREGPWE
jgi:streptogramin lyase